MPTATRVVQRRGRRRRRRLCQPQPESQRRGRRRRRRLCQPQPEPNAGAAAAGAGYANRNQGSQRGAAAAGAGYANRNQGPNYSNAGAAAAGAGYANATSTTSTIPAWSTATGTATTMPAGAHGLRRGLRRAGSGPGAPARRCTAGAIRATAIPTPAARCRVGWRFAQQPSTHRSSPRPRPYNYSQPISTTAAPPEQAVAGQATSAFDQAREAFKAGDYAQALQLDQQALAQMPNDTTMHEFLALVYFAQGKYEQAAAPLYAVLSVGPGWDWTTLSGMYADVDDLHPSAPGPGGQRQGKPGFGPGPLRAGLPVPGPGA